MSFPSDYSVEESVARLSAATDGSIVASVTKEFAAGTVSETRVELQWIRPWFGNSFKPMFVGAFRNRSGRTILVGEFGAFSATRGFMRLWFAFLGFMFVVVSFEALVSKDVQFVWAFLGVIGMAVLGVALTTFAWNWSVSDIDDLSSVIRHALHRLPPLPNHPDVGPPPSTEYRPPSRSRM